MKYNRLICFFGLPILFGLLACSDWTKTETVESPVTRPADFDPERWAEYTADLREYKQREHFIVYAQLFNSPENPASEKDFMRCLPDSLDYVALTNADNFSAYDREDMPMMREKGIKVLYRVDYAARAEEFATTAELGEYLDRVVSSVAENGLDGYAFTGIPGSDPSVASASAMIVSKLSADAGKVLVFEGNPLFVAAGDRAKIDLFVLDTEKTQYMLDVKFQVLDATEGSGIPARKLLLAAAIGSSVLDEELVKYSAVEEMARRVITLGPLCGLGVYNIAGDYYHAAMNYETLRHAIQALNPGN